ncbi:MAG: L-histidine N(alpha)-methyltransferase [Deltaproteobacteria bacterium]|nr:L-histidine N(alpha)-methyltransferase [Deltaproteobacteria bacterium]
MVRNSESDTLAEVLAGLRSSPKRLPSRLLYDVRGAALFEQICAVDDYYLARAETTLLRDHRSMIADAIGPDARIIEPGSGAGQKTRLLLDALVRPSSYVPIDISAEQLVRTAAALRREFPALEVDPVCDDFTTAIVPPPRRPTGRTAIFFPGSTIGNFEPVDAVRLLARFAAIAGDGGMLLLGADSNTDADSLIRAYDDAEGVTAAFDLNVLAHLNRSLDARFDLAAFRHRAVWNRMTSRIEMWLVSRRRQTIAIADHAIAFERNEILVTEHCYKYPAPVLEVLLTQARWSVRQVITDPDGRMRLWLATRP